MFYFYPRASHYQKKQKQYLKHLARRNETNVAEDDFELHQHLTFLRRVSVLSDTEVLPLQTLRTIISHCAGYKLCDQDNNSNNNNCSSNNSSTNNNPILTEQDIVAVVSRALPVACRIFKNAKHPNTAHSDEATLWLGLLEHVMRCFGHRKKVLQETIRTATFVFLLTSVHAAAPFVQKLTATMITRTQALPFTRNLALECLFFIRIASRLWKGTMCTNNKMTPRPPHDSN